MAYTKGLFVPIYQNYGTDKGFTYKEVGIHFATLNAACGRGIMRKEGNQYFLTDKGVAFITIEHMHTRPTDSVHLRLAGKELGMLCTIHNMDILDAWENPFEYDLNTQIWNFCTKTWCNITWGDKNDSN